MELCGWYLVLSTKYVSTTGITVAPMLNSVANRAVALLVHIMFL